MISVLILTRNEEQDLPGCLASVSWCDDVHVFDSFSPDRTAEIAVALGAHFSQRTFDNYSAQRNAALSTLLFRHEWIFVLDADERLTAELGREVVQAAENAAPEISALRVRRRDFFMGCWLKHAQMSPFYIRLIRHGRAQYVRDVNEVLEVDGRVADLLHPLDHFPFSKGIGHWIDKHNLYSSFEARLIVSGTALADASLKTALFDKDFHRRRGAQKAIFYRMPGRPLINCCYLMFVRGAILDGRAGVTYATLQAIYEYLIVVKTRELREEQRLARI